MTESEAIEIFKRPAENIKVENGEFRFTSKFSVAYAMAIQAFEEAEKYRAIGTAEGYKRAVEMSKENYLLYAEYKKKVESFEAIGTIERFRELTEKAEPKKPKSRDFYSGYKCGSCGTNIPYQNQKYCCDCGTAIDWE